MVWWRLSGFEFDAWFDYVVMGGLVCLLAGLDLLGGMDFLKYFCLYLVGLALYVDCCVQVIVDCGLMVFTNVDC